MTDPRPDPLVPAEVDLRDFPFTPMFRARLFGSEFHANANDAEWRAGVTLWLKSWDQVPAGTLPTDEISLCRLAELGRDLKTWRKVMGRALHGWHECNDSRLHHKVVAEGIIEAWTRKLEQRDRTAKARAARLAKQLSQTENAQHEGSVTDSVTDEKKRDFASKGQGQGQGQGHLPSTQPIPHQEQEIKNSHSRAGNGSGNGTHSVTIEDPNERMARFQAKLAQHLGRDGWTIVTAATESSSPEHKRSLALCQQAARTLGKGWPKAWPIT